MRSLSLNRLPFRLAIVLAVLAVRPACADEPQPVLADDAVLRTIACGSCIKQRQPIPTLTAVLEAGPDLVVLMGDNVYADTDDPEQIAECYRTLQARPEFARLRAAVPLEATWDDHDFGRNDAGADYPIREASQRVFLDTFVQAPADDARRRRAGIYRSRIVGPKGQRVQLLLLDTRYHRTGLTLRPLPLEPRALGRPGPYAPTDDAKATVLGDEQWTWLEEQLQQPAEVRLVVSSIQVLADGQFFEGWMLFPRERARLISLLQAASGTVVVLSGDRHHAELCDLPADENGGRILELTSSSLNEPSRWKNERSSYRVGSKFHEANFGFLTLDWTARTVQLDIRDDRGTPMLRMEEPMTAE